MHLPLETLVLPSEYMHEVCLGVVKKLIFLYFDETHTNAEFSVRDRLPDFEVAMKNITPPYFLSRNPKPFSEFSRWKGKNCNFNKKEKGLIFLPDPQLSNLGISYFTLVLSSSNIYCQENTLKIL